MLQLHFSEYVCCISLHLSAVVFLLVHKVHFSIFINCISTNLYSSQCINCISLNLSTVCDHHPAGGGRAYCECITASGRRRRRKRRRKVRLESTPVDAGRSSCAGGRSLSAQQPVRSQPPARAETDTRCIDHKVLKL